MKAIVNGKIVAPYELIEGKALLYDRTILGIVPAEEIPAGAEVVDADGHLVIPGLIDVHTHGYLGHDAADGNFEGLKVIAEGFVKNGVTSFLPTTMTASMDDIRKSFDVIRRAMKESVSDEWQGAWIPGVNMEGPYLNNAKKGAHPTEHILAADLQFVKDNADVIRLVTIAPEIEGNLEVIREITSTTDIRVALGHSAATFEQANEAFDAGVTQITHLFNAQSSLMHRDPGVVGAALSDDRVYCELIADTFHVHKGLFSMVAKLKGDHLVLITDSLRAAGMTDGVYEMGGEAFYVKGIECRFADGTICGSILRLNQAVKNLLDNTTLSVCDAVRVASLTPARSIGIDAHKGSIEIGKDADLAIVDDNFEVVRTICNGREVYARA